MNELVYGDYLFHSTNKYENFTQAQTTCSSNGSVIANLKGFNFEKLMEKFTEDQAFSLNRYIYLRVQPINNTLDKCYGLLNVFFLNNDDGLDGNVDDVCNNNQFYNGKYNTLCSQKIKNDSPLISKDTESPLASVIIGASVFVFVALLTGLYIYFMRKRQLTKRTLQTSSLEEHQIIEESENVSFFLFDNNCM